MWRSSAVWVLLAVVGCGDSHAAPPGDTGLTRAGAAPAAVAVGSCLPTQDPVGHLRVFQYEDEAFSLLRFYGECLADVTNGCDGVEACAGVRAEPACEARGRCEGNRAIGCKGGISYDFDCDLLDLACDAGDCVPSERASCDAEGEALLCRDGVPTLCADGEVDQTGRRCDDLGLACEATRDYATCVGSGPECEPPRDRSTYPHTDGLRCDGETLVSCVVGREAELDCAALGAGFGCQRRGEVSFCGLAAECDPTESGPATCDGDDLVLCNAGRLERVHCPALGFERCIPGGGVCGPGPFDGT